MSHNNGNSIVNVFLFIGAGVSLFMAVKHRPMKQTVYGKNPISFSQDWRPSTIEKHLSPIRVILNNPKIPSFDTSEVLIKAQIESTIKSNEEISFTWILPEGVHVIDGKQSGSLQFSSASSLQYIDLKVQNFSKENFKTISIQVAGKESQTGGVATISSRPEDTMESIAPAMQKEVKRAEAASAVVQ